MANSNSHLVLQEVSSDQNMECTTPAVGQHEDLDAVGGEDDVGKVTEEGLVDGPGIRLPEGWEVLIDDDTGVDYYHHIETGHVQWESPVTALVEESLPTSPGTLSQQHIAVGQESTEEVEQKEQSNLYPQPPGSAGEEGSEEDVLRQRHSLMLLGAGPSEQDISRAKGDLEDLKSFMAKLVLGNDFSGGKHGDAPALTVSLAITNLAAGAFGEMKRLQPVAPEVHAKWKRELEWLLLPLTQVQDIVYTHACPVGLSVTLNRWWVTSYIVRDHSCRSWCSSQLNKC